MYRSLGANGPWLLHSVTSVNTYGLSDCLQAILKKPHDVNLVNDCLSKHQKGGTFRFWLLANILPNTNLSANDHALSQLHPHFAKKHQDGKKTLSSRPVGGVTVDTRILYAVCDLRRSDQVNYSKYK